jgi:hypothetical protein
LGGDGLVVDHVVIVVVGVWSVDEHTVVPVHGTLVAVVVAMRSDVTTMGVGPTHSDLVLTASLRCSMPPGSFSAKSSCVLGLSTPTL